MCACMIEGVCVHACACMILGVCVHAYVRMWFKRNHNSFKVRDDLCSGLSGTWCIVHDTMLHMLRVEAY